MRRHTMGQDQAKPPPLNPPGAPRVSRAQVEQAAAALGVEVKRDGLERMWWIKRPGDVWRTYRQTNYLTLTALQYELEAAS
ncbi:hypothetical protein KIKIMORA_01470 [Brevundimonas phage vB_BpoS-Kikimora]|uniref:Uncharacterized protein n=1 Tax=Brevundimonas phage vB_BpoS-Kikimora TaxID=2948601 RepID=A0A9E7SK93_9CAUD|nr:hypothetical protein KIKIMORA_01470 [Brevundimonas phage vB_BpoS-Kikimora]